MPRGFSFRNRRIPGTVLGLTSSRVQNPDGKSRRRATASTQQSGQGKVTKTRSKYRGRIIVHELVVGMEVSFGPETRAQYSYVPLGPSNDMSRER